jgi:hypothetical protein
MASRFDQIITSVEAALGSPIAHDQRELASLNDAPRIVASLSGGTITPSDRVGGQKDAVAGTSSRQILIRRVGVTFNVWGRDREEAETLLHNLLAAVWHEANAAIEFGAETWLDQEPGEDGYQRRGSMVEMVCVFSVPVFDTIVPIKRGPIGHVGETSFGGAVYGQCTYGHAVYGSSMNIGCD